MGFHLQSCQYSSFFLVLNFKSLFCNLLRASLSRQNSSTSNNLLLSYPICTCSCTSWYFSSSWPPMCCAIMMFLRTLRLRIKPHSAYLTGGFCYTEKLHIRDVLLVTLTQFDVNKHMKGSNKSH